MTVAEATESYQTALETLRALPAWHEDVPQEKLEELRRDLQEVLEEAERHMIEAHRRHEYDRYWKE